MKTRAAILRGVRQPWEVVTLDLAEPGRGEVLVRMVAAGLCHSDDHSVTGDVPREYYPYCGGHEGAGVVEEVGEGVTAVEVGDHIVVSFVPSCGRCRSCAAGRQNLCDRGQLTLKGTHLDGSYRMHLAGEGIGGGTSTFSEWSVLSERSCVPVPEDLDLKVACLLSCGVPTGVGSAIHAAAVAPGDVVIVVGVGGIGMNAVQGAVLAGARRVIAVDPVPFKREQARHFGASDTASTIEEGATLARELTNGQGADSVVLSVGVVRPPDVTESLAAVGKGGTLALTGVGRRGRQPIELDLFELAMWQKRVQGVLYGMSSPAREIPRLVELYQDGRLRLDELITRTYSLEEINDGFADMHAGRTIRGVIEFPPPID